MSLAYDFSMYYRNTFVGYKGEDGRVYPMAVQEVSGNSDGYDQETMDNLVFHGIVLNDDRDVRVDVRLGSGDLVLELPELGYIYQEGRPRWLTYTPVQQASKGLSSRRVVGARITNSIARAIYKALHDQPDHLARQFCFHNGTVLYKGVCIGTCESESDVVIKSNRQYLIPYLNKVFPNLQVSIEA